MKLLKLKKADMSTSLVHPSQQVSCRSGRWCLSAD